MNSTEEKTIGEFVAADYRTAAVFKKYGIDFCCNGNRPIEEACAENNSNADQVKKDIFDVICSPGYTGNANSDFKTWPLDLLADYIEKKHHRYVTAQLPLLNAYLEKLCNVHGTKHPELFEIKDLFKGCAAELKAHMIKEESMLFPYIRKMVRAKEEEKNNIASPFGKVQNPIRMMMQEHDTEGKRFRKISALSNNYTAPADGCGTYSVTYALLQEFETDLQLHIHLENNILFPNAVVMETAFNN